MCHRLCRNAACLLRHCQKEYESIVIFCGGWSYTEETDQNRLIETSCLVGFLFYRKKTVCWVEEAAWFSFAVVVFVVACERVEVGLFVFVCAILPMLFLSYSERVGIVGLV